jgi:hypothetical protein
MAKTRSTPTLKWNSRSKANKMLVDGLIAGTIDPSKRPKEIWESNPEFGRYLLPSFCSAFNRNKHKTGTFIRSKGKIKIMCHSCLPELMFTHCLTTTVDDLPLLLQTTSMRQMTQNMMRAPTMKKRTPPQRATSSRFCISLVCWRWYLHPWSPTAIPWASTGNNHGCQTTLWLCGKLKNLQDGDCVCGLQQRRQLDNRRQLLHLGRWYTA